MHCTYFCITRDTTQSSSFPWWEPPEGYEPIPYDSNVHGECWLHKDYYLARVPPTASLEFAFDDKIKTPVFEPEFIHKKPTLASSLNLVKLFIGLIQAIWATITIYR